ncbi:DUF421 domain-containing protein [Ammoniphilus sp. YIM 78166]|uniref:DUF421 domain-containing protein n=1 Tax=Ammoniphilus sp. YIM 78166 TaxID=1644106 RepID=UPI00106F6F7A|nr:DUF421 domain-containing protein [Ammoniphilus sp. YIM 78166]
MTWIEISIRTLAAFAVLFLWARILGKKLISQMTLFDFMAGIALGSATATVMFNQDLPLAMGLFGLSLFAIIILALEFSTLKSFRMRKLVNSEPTLVIKDGKILEEGMKAARLTVDDLLYLLREKDSFYVDEVELAFFESNGKLSLMKKPEADSVKRKDIQVAVPSRGLPQSFIMDGKILKHSLISMNKDEQWVQSILNANGIEKVEDVFFGQIDQQNQVYLDTRQDQLHNVH